MLWLAQALLAGLAHAQYSNNTPSGLNFAESPPFYPSPWVEDTNGDWADAITKAKAFVSQLTLLEKVNLTTGTGWQSESCVGNVGAIPRLGFDSLCMQDSPLGIRFADYVSAFPAGGTVAGSWDRAEFYQRGYQMGQEHRAKGVDVQLGPVVGPLGRNPKGGRNWEGFSPDPVLSGIAVADTVRGIQDAGVIACTKHFIMNEQEHFRQPGNFEDFGFVDALSSNLDDKTLHELYLWPFADAIRAGTGSIMCSYNKVNNSQVCQNSYLQNYILKGELGFQGFIMSDWDAQHSGVASTLAGLDMTMPGDTDFNSGQSFWGPNLTISVLNGTLPQWRLDDAAVRIMAAYYYVGLDESIPVNFDSWQRDTYGYEHYFAKTGQKLVNQHVDDGETLVQNVSALCNNTIVVVHSVGPVLLNSFVDNENVTAILWAGLPGQESGNAIADILYGRENPGGKLPFTIGSSAEEYGPDLIYEPTNGHGSPQDNFEEGIFIDYRAFDKKNITPVYEFGHGMSYTTFEYSDIKVAKVDAGAYTPTTGKTIAAPTLGNYSRDIEEYQFPANATRPATYIFPYLNSTNLAEASQDPEYGVNHTWPSGATDGSPQARIAAGGAPGGNPQLWDVLYTVEATITNSGKVAGDEVVQCYIALGGPDDPKVQLRGFDRLSIQPGKSATFHADITRRDISNWDVASQNWVISEYPKTVYVGASSRKLHLSAAMDTSAYRM
ncbi:beta-glucosidase 2 precursor [Pyrenophora tritici-repentis Pt-1C-BFP]|uniref:beta-glucosidase n=1 Tax=Pyrenophora tritici-repentis (strain Pt-1C-BFP) TaxID=426418 RepID=B2VWY7_PYRTR|nr:beta-glucosidase 2 precursor [Pyrenophora tritici-repentis Pt-1C-BFP]EDU39662.1 beta-glucosidase 2 precursor [Pyrenophora tritici-repentis Pt-1C-BFP]